METVTIELPKHAARYLAKMCERERIFLAHSPALDNITLQGDATFDSLRAIEDALPLDAALR
jgi:hypothetical protein